MNIVDLKSGTIKRPWWENGVGRTAIELVSGIILGLLLPRASVYGGLMPFGIGLTAAVTGPGTVLVFLATLMGYLLCGAAVSLRYVAALVAVAGIRWAVNGFHAVSRSILFPVTVSFSGLLITGAALLPGGASSLGDILTIVAESLLGGGFAYFAALLWREIPYWGERQLSEQGQLSAIVLSAVIMMSLLTIHISGISPGRILCGMIILLAARCASVTGGTLVGILMGASVLLATPDMAHLAPAFALGGALAGVFSEKGKVVSSLMYIVAVGIATVQASHETVIIIGLYEAVASCVLFLAMPTVVGTAIERVFLKTRQLPQVKSSRQAVSSKLAFAAKAMSEVVGTVDAVSCQLTTVALPEINNICREGTDEICRHCKKRVGCWETYFSAIMDSLNHAVPILREAGEITTENIGGFLKNNCPNTEKIALAITARYREFLVQESAFRRLQELRNSVNDQFDSMSTMLSEFAQRLSFPEWSDTDTEKRIQKVLRKEKVNVQTISCLVNDQGRMTIEILLNGRYQPHDKDTFRKKLNEECGRQFCSPLTEYASGLTRISFVEKPKYRIAVGAAQIACKGESLCGDSYEIVRDNEGRQLLVLSDGMGSGGSAAVDSAMAAGLAVRLLKAGFGYESMLKMVNTALMTKSEDESLATLDIVEINLFNGNTSVLKAGAGASLLYSKGRVSHIEDSSLPLGILRDLTFAHTRDRLVEGDVFIVMSDGVSNGGIDWVEDMIKLFDLENDGRLSELATAIAEKAQELQEDDPDDITVLVAQVQTAI